MDAKPTLGSTFHFPPYASGLNYSLSSLSDKVNCRGALLAHNLYSELAAVTSWTLKY